MLRDIPYIERDIPDAAQHREGRDEVTAAPRQEADCSEHAGYIILPGQGSEEERGTQKDLRQHERRNKMGLAAENRDRVNDAEQRACPCQNQSQLSFGPWYQSNDG